MEDSDDDFTAVIKVNKHFENRYGGDNRQKVNDRELEWLTQRSHCTQLDLASLKASHIELEFKYKLLETRLKDERLKFEFEMDKKDKENQLNKAEVSDLKHQLSIISSKYETLKEVSEGVRKESVSLKKQILDKENIKLSSSLTTQLELDKVKQDFQAYRAAAEREMDFLRREIKEIASEREEADVEMKRLTSKLSDYKDMESQLEETKYQLSLAVQKNRESELEHSRADEFLAKAELAKTKLEKIESLTSENKTLKQELTYYKVTHKNYDIVKEQCIGLQNKLDRALMNCQHLEDTKLENEVLNKKLKEFEKLIKSIPGAKNAHDVMEKMLELTHINERYLRMCGELRKEQRSIEEENSTLRSEADVSMKEINQLKTTRDQLKRVQNKLRLVTAERDNYKKIIDTYERDLTFSTSAYYEDCIDSTSNSSQRQQQRSINKTINNNSSVNNSRTTTLTQRLQLLETQYNNLVADYKKCDTENNEHLQKIEKLNEKIIELEHSLNDREKVARKVMIMSRDDDDKSADDILVKSLRKTIEELKSKLLESEMKYERLECAMDANDMRGVYNPGQTQAIMMKGPNPYQTFRQKIVQQLEKKEEENQHLKMKIKTLMETKQDEDLTVKTSAMIASLGSVKEQEELKAQLQKVELINKRLTENYEKISQNVKKLVSTLLGYTFEKMGESLYKLCSIFAKLPEEYFLISQLPDGEFELLGNQYSESFSDLIEIYLRGPNALPPFMSAVTLRLRGDLQDDTTMIE